MLDVVSWERPNRRINHELIVETAHMSEATNGWIAVQLEVGIRWQWWKGRQWTDHENPYVLIILKPIGSHGIIFSLVSHLGNNVDVRMG